MATTQIKSLHINSKKTAEQSIKDRLDYIMNPDKTEAGTLISTSGCAARTAANEFALHRSAYLTNTGRKIPNEIIGYHVRQAFKPGEITPEKANEIGKKLAQQITNGDYAYVVATHTDRKHIHNHIILCSFPIDGTRKYRDVLRSSKDIFRISDDLCRQNGLSIVEKPKGKTVSYDKWQGNNRSVTHRDEVRIAIDTAMRLKPDGFDALMRLMEEAGYAIKRAAHISIKPPDGKRYIRLETLGAEYTEEALRRSLEGQHIHIPKTPRTDYTVSQVKRLVDIEAKLREGKGKGYAVWAERNNIDAKAQSVIFLKENHISSLDELESRIQHLLSERNTLLASIRKTQAELKEISQQRRAIRDYRRTKEVYTQYRDSGWSPVFYQQHQKEIDTHRQAQEVYAVHDGKLPTLKELTADYEKLRQRKEATYAQLEQTKSALTTLKHIRYNYQILERDALADRKEHERSVKRAR